MSKNILVSPFFVFVRVVSVVRVSACFDGNADDTGDADDADFLFKRMLRSFFVRAYLRASMATRTTRATRIFCLSVCCAPLLHAFKAFAAQLLPDFVALVQRTVIFGRCIAP